MPERIVAQWSQRTHIPSAYLRPIVYGMRRAKLLAYLLLTIAGGCAMVPGLQPPAIQQAAASVVQIYVWAGVLVVSGGLCFYGELRGSWWGEYIGLLPLCLLSMVYAITAIIQGDGGIARGCFLLALSSFCLAAWSNAAWVRAVAAHEAARSLRDQQRERG
jgi:hypothetical protein